MTTFLDTSVLVYLLKPDSEYHEWSIKKFDEAKEQGPVVISNIVYSEFSVGMDSVAQINEIIAGLAIERIPPSDDSLFAAGRAFHEYKNTNQGLKSNVLSDYLIGAEALEEGGSLLTNNRKDFEKYFPGLELISP